MWTYETVVVAGQRWCPRQDSNLRSRLRRAVLYPLSYGGRTAATLAHPTGGLTDRPRQPHPRRGVAGNPLVTPHAIPTLFLESHHPMSRERRDAAEHERHELLVAARWPRAAHPARRDRAGGRRGRTRRAVGRRSPP